MRTKILAGSMATLLAHTMATAAPAPAALAPMGPWNIEFADRTCLLSRPYGNDRAINLILKPSMLGDGIEVIVTKKTTRNADRVYGKAALATGGRQAVPDASFTAYSTATQRLLRISINDDKLRLATVRETLSIDAKPESRHSFAIPGIERALPVLSQCVEDLRAIYKVGATDLKDVVTKPDGSNVSLFTTNDYPAEALAKGQFGTVGVLLWVESNGRISTCDVIESSAGPVLEQTTCNILQRRARMAPARDASGRPIRAPIFTRIRWELPG